MISKLSDLEIANSLESDIPGWSLNGKKVRRQWYFKNFVEAFSFMTKVALLSEAMNHHPEFKNVYNEVIIELITHDIGGISEKDINLAKKINAL